MTQYVYRIMNPAPKTYVIQRRPVGPVLADETRDYKDVGEKYTTFQGAREALRNLAIADTEKASFVPGYWVFSEPQAIHLTQAQPVRQVV
jgi:hypothetical protein